MEKQKKKTPPSSCYKKRDISALKLKNRRNDLRARRLQTWCRLGGLAKSENWVTHHKHIFMGAGKYDNKHGVGIMLNKKVATTNHRYWVHQRKCHHNNDFGRPSTHQADERILSPHQVCQPSRREAHEFQQIVYRRLERCFGARIRSWAFECWPAHTQRRKQKRRLAEALADVTKFHSTQHDIQKDAWETHDLQIS